MILSNVMAEENVKQRLKRVLEYYNVTQNKLAEGDSALQKRLSTQLNGKTALSFQTISSILERFPDVSSEWVLSGTGKMIKEKDDAHTTGTAIPLIPVNAVGGYLSGVSSQIKDYECEMYTMPLFRGADFLIKVEGDSMMPKYMPGDIVACKKVEGRLWFQWGKVYVVDTKQGALIKKIEPAEEDGCILLCSENEKYKPFKLYAEDINGVALVKGVIRVE